MVQGQRGQRPRDRGLTEALANAPPKRCGAFPREASVDGRLRESEERALPELQTTRRTGLTPIVSGNLTPLAQELRTHVQVVGTTKPVIQRHGDEPLGSGRRGYQVPRVSCQHGVDPEPPGGMLPSSCEAWARWMAFAAFWCPGVKALADHPRFASTQPVRPRTPRSAGTQHPHRAMGPPRRTEHRCVSARTSLDSRLATKPCPPHQPRPLPSLLPAESVPRSRPRPTLGSSRRSTSRRAGNAHIRVDGPSPSHRGRRARSARQSHRRGTRFRP